MTRNEYLTEFHAIKTALANASKAVLAIDIASVGRDWTDAETTKRIALVNEWNRLRGVMDIFIKGWQVAK
jgi:hypothetical protein